jgi:parallel beta-helix repeat protein
MPGKGELYQRSDGQWDFRVKAASGDVVANDAGTGFPTKAKAKTVLQKLLKGDYNGPITEAGGIGCGTEITQSTTLGGDLKCPKGGPALTITADNVTLDLGGHTVSGDPKHTGDNAGILLKNVKGCTVKNGTVQGFDAGIVIAGGSGNTIQGITLQDNIGNPDGDFGDGIVVNGSSKNRIEGNTVQRNGPFSGIAIGPDSQGNEVKGNTVTDNNMMHTGDKTQGNQDMGIRIEGPAADKNKVTANTVTGSGANGIVVLATCGDPNSSPPCAGTPPNKGNEISNNQCHKNGTSGRGAGIALFAMANPVPPTQTTITGNAANENVSFGITVDAGATKNKITKNSAHKNGQFDGNDGNGGCGDNTWQGNDFGLANQPCVAGPKATMARMAGVV